MHEIAAEVVKLYKKLSILFKSEQVTISIILKMI